MSRSNYAELIRSGALELRQAGIDDPVREARQLLRLASGLSTAELIAREKDEPPADTLAKFEALIRKRAQRMPFAHLSGSAAFFGLTLKSDHRALIPRPDSECVVDLALSYVPADANWAIADLGTGTGALLAAVLDQRPKSKGIAVEASADAADLAAENFEALSLSDRTQVFRGSWADWQDWRTCDLIISNPPYIRSHVIAELAPEVRDHDPRDALDGGIDGLTAYREIITLAAGDVKRGAHLILEIGYDQKAAVTALLEREGFAHLQHAQDLGGNDRAIAATKT